MDRITGNPVGQSSTQLSVALNVNKAALTRCCIKPGYQERHGLLGRAVRKAYSGNIAHQPDLFALAATLGFRFGAETIVHIGCGSGRQLMSIQGFQRIGVDHKAKIESCRLHFPDAIWIDADLEQVGELGISIDAIKRSIVICTDVFECLQDPAPLLRMLGGLRRHAPAIIITTPERDLVHGQRHKGPPPNPERAREWSLPEFQHLLKKYDLAPTFIGLTGNNGNHLPKNTIVSIIDQCPLDKGRTAPAEFRPLAIVATYNEVDIARQTLSALLDDGIDVHVLDNWSMDGTFEDLKLLANQRRGISIERFPAQEESRYFEWKSILQFKEEIATRHPGRWIIHHDSDELRCSPWADISFRQGLHVAEQMGFNAIDFTVCEFRPIDESFTQGSNPEKQLPYFEFGKRTDQFIQVKAWRQGAHKVDLASSGGHHVRFTGRRLFPYNFILKHFSLRSPVQAREKLCSRKGRFSPLEREQGWHVQYDDLQVDDPFIWNKSKLIYFDEHETRSAYLIELIAGVGIDRDGSAAHSAAEIARLRSDLQSANFEISRYNQHEREQQALVVAHETRVADLEKELKELQNRLDQRAAELAALEKLLDARAAEAGQLRTQMEIARGCQQKCERTIEAQRFELAQLQAAHRRADYGVAELARQVASQSKSLQRIKASTSWRLTAPLRSIGRRFPGMRRFLRKHLELIPWLKTDIKRIRSSTFFDEEWYTKRYPDVMAAGSDPATHYLQYGAAEGRKPSEGFDTDWYLAENPDVAERGINPLVHYTRYGAGEGRHVASVFDSTCYRAKYDDSPQSTLGTAIHYLWYGGGQGRDPNAWFDSDWYLRHNSDVEAANRNPLVHYAHGGASAGRAPNPLCEGASPRLKEFLQSRFGAESTNLVDEVYKVLGRWIGRFISATELRDSKQLQGLVAEIAQSAREAMKGGREFDPRVSIIIPVHNNIIHTLCCLKSLFSWPTNHSFEVIIADDASSDATAEAIAGVGGNVRHHRSGSNLGFTLNCNHAARGASGEVLVFLNNDTIPLPHWLDELMQLAQEPSVGLVGAKLLNVDGTVQEAGGIIWNDGSAWNFGRGEDPDASEFNYVKDVDYVSGAVIAIRKLLWNEVGGFDAAFAPAYCEDTDLAFSLRTRGLRIVYCPFSAIIHHEGASHGTDVTRGVKAAQVLNQAKLVEKWKDELSAGQCPNAENVFLARDRSRWKAHILIIDHYTPQFDKDAGSRTMMHIIELLVSRGFQISFWPENLHYDSYARHLQKMGVEVLYGNRHAGQFAHWLQEHGRYFDYVLLSRAHIAVNCLDAIKRLTSAKILFYGHDLMFTSMEMERSVCEKPKLNDEISRWKRIGLETWRNVDVIYYPSEEECEYVRSTVPGKIVRRLPAYAYDECSLERESKTSTAPREGKELTFVGGFRHPPNVDGIVWFCEKVLPIVVERHPDLHLNIVGSFTPPEVRNLAGPNVLIKGWMTDEELEALYRASSMVVVPLRFGGGVKGKVVEALRFGVPVVTTAVAAQGLPEAQEVLWLAEDASGFAEHICRLLEDPEAGLQKARRGIEFIRREYSRSALSDVLRRDLNEFIRENGAQKETFEKFDAGADWDGTSTREIVVGSHAIEGADGMKYVWIGDKARMVFRPGSAAEGIRVKGCLPRRVHAERTGVTDLWVSVAVNGRIIGSITSSTDDSFDEVFDISGVPWRDGALELELFPNNVLGPTIEDPRRLSFILNVAEVISASDPSAAGSVASTEVSSVSDAGVAGCGAEVEVSNAS